MANLRDLNQTNQNPFWDWVADFQKQAQKAPEKDSKDDEKHNGESSESQRTTPAADNLEKHDHDMNNEKDIPDPGEELPDFEEATASRPGVWDPYAAVFDRYPQPPRGMFGPPPPPGPHPPPPHPRGPPHHGHHSPPRRRSPSPGRGRGGPRGGRGHHRGRGGHHHDQEHHSHHGHWHGPPRGGPFGFGGWPGAWGRGGHRGRHGRNGPFDMFTQGGFDMEKLNEFLKNFGIDASAYTGVRGPANQDDEKDFTPSVDVFDTTSAFFIHLSLAGAKKQDLDVSWDAESFQVIVSGIIHRPGDEEFLKTIAVDERDIGVFERKIKLGTKIDPVSVDADGIAARMEDGVLMIKVPKLQEEFVEIKKIDIE